MTTIVAAGTVGDNPRGGDVERGVEFSTFLDRLRAESRVGGE